MTGEKQIVYDRTPDMEIRLSDGRVVTLGELESMEMIHGKLFAYAPWSKSWNISRRRSPRPRPSWFT